MKHLTLTLKDEITTLNKYRITPNELMFIRTLLLLQDEEDEDTFKTYIETLHDCDISIEKVILALQDKEIILKSYKCPKKEKTFDPYSIPFNKNFVKNLYRSSFEMGKELFDVYPQFGNIGGCMVHLRSVAKKFDSLEDCYFKYGKTIKWKDELHRKIIDLVKWGKDNNIINQTLASFVVNQAWIDLEALKNGDSGNINYDNIKLL